MWLQNKMTGLSQELAQQLVHRLGHKLVPEHHDGIFVTALKWHELAPQLGQTLASEQDGGVVMIVWIRDWQNSWRCIRLTGRSFESVGQAAGSEIRPNNCRQNHVRSRHGSVQDSVLLPIARPQVRMLPITKNDVQGPRARTFCKFPISVSPRANTRIPARRRPPCSGWKGQVEDHVQGFRFAMNF